MYPATSNTSNRCAKGLINLSYNDSRVTDRKLFDQEDLDSRSVITASTACTEDDDRLAPEIGKKQGQELLGMLTQQTRTEELPPVPPPPTPPPKTKLQSGAALFVPKASQGFQAPTFASNSCCPGASSMSWSPACTQTGGNLWPNGKDCLKELIQRTFGSELWNLSMVDCQRYSGEWFTAVEIAIPELSSNFSHLAGSQDLSMLSAAKQATENMASQSLIKALQPLYPYVNIVPSEDATSPNQFSVQYCSADRDTLCWEYACSGHCPRGESCRWAHSLIENFSISFALQPIQRWEAVIMPAAYAAECQVAAPYNGSIDNGSSAAWAPPMQVVASSSSAPLALPVSYFAGDGCSQASALPAAFDPSTCQAQDSGLSSAAINGTASNSLQATAAKARSNRSWADIKDDNDEPFDPQWH